MTEKFLLSSQRFSIYPSWQPLGHTPLTWSHGSLFLQWPLQCSLQSNPKCTGEHSVQRKMFLMFKTCYTINWNLLINVFKVCVCTIKQKKVNNFKALIGNLTFATVPVSISRFTSPVIVFSLFVTWRVVQTMSTTVVDTLRTIGPSSHSITGIYFLSY